MSSYKFIETFFISGGDKFNLCQLWLVWYDILPSHGWWHVHKPSSLYFHHLSSFEWQQLKLNSSHGFDEIPSHDQRIVWFCWPHSFMEEEESLTPEWRGNSWLNSCQSSKLVGLNFSLKVEQTTITDNGPLKIQLKSPWLTAKLYFWF